MIDFDEACDLIFSHCNGLGTHDCSIEDAVGMVLAEDIVSDVDVSPFRNSAMDGFAVRAEWLAGCSQSEPVTMPIDSTVFAGDVSIGSSAGERVVKVMTGAIVDNAFDSVVPFELTEYDDSQVTFTKPISPGANVRKPGEDVSCGQTIFRKGRVIRLLDVGILAGIGQATVPVVRKPSMLVAGTGDELVKPGEKLAEGKIYESNTFTIRSLVAGWTRKVETVARVADQVDGLKALLGSDHDVIVTSGGVSAGERDLVVPTALSCGWLEVFHKIKLKPGKPVFFAVRGRQLLFGLPGNPLSTAVTCAILVIPALKKICGRNNYRIKPFPALMPQSEVRKTGRKLIWPGSIEPGDNPRVKFSAKRSSAALSALIDSDGLIIQPVAKKGEAGIEVEAVRWNEILNH